MISTDSLMHGLGTFMTIAGIFLAMKLIFNKSIWNYPVVASMYIIQMLFFLIAGIILIKELEITPAMDVIAIAVIIVWAVITFHLPARKQEMVKAQKTLK